MQIQTSPDYQLTLVVGTTAATWEGMTAEVHTVRNSAAAGQVALATSQKSTSARASLSSPRCVASQDRPVRLKNVLPLIAAVQDVKTHIHRAGPVPRHRLMLAHNRYRCL